MGIVGLQGVGFQEEAHENSSTPLDCSTAHFLHLSMWTVRICFFETWSACSEPSLFYEVMQIECGL